MPINTADEQATGLEFSHRLSVHRAADLAMGLGQVFRRLVPAGLQRAPAGSSWRQLTSASRVCTA